MAVAYLILFVFAGLPLPAQEPVFNTTCPVMPDREVDEEAVVLVHDGKEVRVCCEQCRGDFLSAPSRYVDRLPQFSSVARAVGHGGQEEHGPDAADPHDHAAHEHRGPLEFLGRFHPMVVHFPIALLTLALILEMWALARRRQAYNLATRPLVLFGAAASVVAVLLGFALAGENNYAGSLQSVFESHRFLGIVTAALAALAASLAEWGRRAEGAKRYRPYLAALFLGTAVLTVAAHKGATLVYGLNYFSYPE